jgi:hypothetical protein
VIIRDIFILFENKIIRLATSRPRHFLHHHLEQHCCKTATAHLAQSPLNVINAGDPGQWMYMKNLTKNPKIEVLEGTLIQWMKLEDEDQLG